MYYLCSTTSSAEIFKKRLYKNFRLRKIKLCHCTRGIVKLKVVLTFVFRNENLHSYRPPFVHNEIEVRALEHWLRRYARTRTPVTGIRISEAEAKHRLSKHFKRQFETITRG